ncbi:cellulose binding domain-containing protein [Actinoplanes oblitus]|uniref:Cellulose binding domain-containing protein n=1 Tax=Actinoplanes oblitus TaxID=3040509 RepID=A0ABY8WPW1_9ACTN|nr:cellulose binding domain-containing protein [Actinoplanes oblitus]WIM99909.1 cellulose binding domain-containing protein [Actinoplanes oblitus]
MAGSKRREGGFREGVRHLLPWAPTVVGVGALLFMLLVTMFRLSPAERDDDTALGPVLPPPAPRETVVVTPSPAGPRPSSPAARSAHSRRPVIWSPSSATPAPRSTTPAPRPTTTRAPAAAVTGRYGVVGTYDTEFIGEVAISNATGEPRDWTVTLRFPDNVGDLRTSWVESAPQATLSRSGDSFVWRSGVPVGAGSTVVLRFQFARTGTGDRPAACTVNTSRCT